LPGSLAWFRLVDSAVTNPASTPAVETFAANTLRAALFLCCFAKRCRFYWYGILSLGAATRYWSGAL